VAEFIYWSCLLLPVYAYLGYPVLLTLLTPFFPVRRYGKPLPMDVSIVIAAHNEARHIEEKLRTLLAQDYRAHSLRIILASDGSTDDTVACARNVIDPRITVLDLPPIATARSWCSPTRTINGPPTRSATCWRRWAIRKLAPAPGTWTSPCRAKA
jgi:cellulose synthase/poly-beta-1,6-N-acetylglucosamine synthase-like glycosyltransferase